VAVLRPDGVIAHHQAPGANPNLVGMDEFLRRLGDAVSEALSAAELKRVDIDSAGFGLSGVDRPDQVERITAEVRSAVLLPACRRLWVGNDAMAALRQGAGALRGMILIAGTGSICFGVGERGRRPRRRLGQRTRRRGQRLLDRPERPAGGLSHGRRPHPPKLARQCRPP
jgi:N-acetylglucosamine kinase-like BadF-type ATPase